VVYARTLGSSVFTFQVSGMLWRNSLIMKDRETGTLWSHITGRALQGKVQGAQLAKIDSVQTTWRQWFTTHPETSLLAKSEEVQSSHYQRYFSDPERMGLFRAQWLMDVMPGKTLVYGVAVDAHAVAVTEEALDNRPIVTVELGAAPIVVSRGGDGGVRAFVAAVDGERVALRRDATTGEFKDADGVVWDLVSGRSTSGPQSGHRLEAVAVTPVYWFAWSNFYPNTQVID
jgi:hypothetical protein